MSTEERVCNQRYPAPTPNNPEQTRPCHGFIQRRIYTDGWYIENCDSCPYIGGGFENRNPETPEHRRYGTWIK